MTSDMLNVILLSYKKDLGQAQPYIATTTVSKKYNLTEDNLTIE
jgi:hypothetical protein